MPSSNDLTADQIRLIGGTEWLLAKTAATTTLKNHLDGLRAVLLPEVAAQHDRWDTPATFDPAASQIARGENLGGLPYNYLDCPRHFSRGHYFSFRTLVWWGKGLICCWMLAGEGVEVYRQRLLALENRPDLGVWCGEDPWGWDGFTPLAALPPGGLEKLDYLKFGLMQPLSADTLTKAALHETALRAFQAGLPVVQSG